MKQGYRGIARFIGECVLDEKRNPNYIVCDAERYKFRYYFEYLWRDDINGRKLVDEVYPYIASEISRICTLEMERLKKRSLSLRLNYITPEYCEYLEFVTCIKNGNHLNYGCYLNKCVCKELRIILKHCKQS